MKEHEGVRRRRKEATSFQGCSRIPVFVACAEPTNPIQPLFAPRMLLSTFRYIAFQSHNLSAPTYLE